MLCHKAEAPDSAVQFGRGICRVLPRQDELQQDEFSSRSVCVSHQDRVCSGFLVVVLFWARAAAVLRPPLALAIPLSQLRTSCV